MTSNPATSSSSKRKKEIIGRGVVEGEYVYDPTVSTTVTPVLSAGQTKVYGSILKQLAMKTLTDVTPYTDFVKKTQSLLMEKAQMLLSKTRDEEERTYDPYTADDFPA